MTFGHDTQLALRSAAGLVNTLDDDGVEGGDSLRTRADLARFLDDFGWYGVRLGDDAELEAVRALRPRLRRWWDLEEGPLVEALNATLAESGALPQLVDHDGLGWHIHAVPQDAPLDARMLVEAAMAFTDVLRAGELERLKACAADDCDNVVVDLSRNRSRRFCEGGCGNRENVRAYRDRQRESD
ncbi:CGNR zinc finger domain-containing protein [Nocardioides aequoreus]|uniref:CGNR zinc finger domain-containing protein n=1 Tax=Nocardioides aequoreus TaxID=397278 RepID=UPI0004C398A4|nr:CGNR zinc finger domain-containing protein [Nocardioides aequoreus]